MGHMVTAIVLCWLPLCHASFNFMPRNTSSLFTLLFFLRHFSLRLSDKKYCVLCHFIIVWFGDFFSFLSVSLLFCPRFVHMKLLDCFSSTKTFSKHFLSWSCLLNLLQFKFIIITQCSNFPFSKLILIAPESVSKFCSEFAYATLYVYANDEIIGFQNL